MYLGVCLSSQLLRRSAQHLSSCVCVSSSSAVDSFLCGPVTAIYIVHRICNGRMCALSWNGLRRTGARYTHVQVTDSMHITKRCTGQ